MGDAPPLLVVSRDRWALVDAPTVHEAFASVPGALAAYTTTRSDRARLAVLAFFESLFAMVEADHG